MDLKQAMNERHSVRSYRNQPIETEKAEALDAFIQECNQKGDLHIQLVLNEPKAFDSFMAHYGKFSGVQNYIALVGKKSKDLQEKIGYYGAAIMLRAQALGLNTCWVALTYKKVKAAFTVDKGEKLCSVLAVGYGQTQGKPHKGKTLEEASSSAITPAPDWFIRGVNAALLAPTAMNQQKFQLALLDNHTVQVSAKSGFYTKMDMGIVKYFFELGAEEEDFVWKK